MGPSDHRLTVLTSISLAFDKKQATIVLYVYSCSTSIVSIVFNLSGLKFGSIIHAVPMISDGITM